MNRYRVVLTADAIMVARMEVEAASEADADAQAVERANAGKADWEFMQLAEPDPQIEAVETRLL